MSSSKCPPRIPIEKVVKLGELTFVGCSPPGTGGGLQPCMASGATVHAVVVGGTDVIIKEIHVENDIIAARTLTWVSITVENPHPYPVTVDFYIPYAGPPAPVEGGAAPAHAPASEHKGPLAHPHIEDAGVYLHRLGAPSYRPVHTEKDGTGRIDPLATQTLRLRIWHDQTGHHLGAWELGVRLYGVVDYCRSRTDCERVMTYVKSDEQDPPVVVPVNLVE